MVLPHEIVKKAVDNLCVDLPELLAGIEPLQRGRVLDAIAEGMAAACGQEHAKWILQQLRESTYRTDDGA